MNSHEQALSKAKVALMAKPDSTFFVSLCFNLIHKFDESIPTAATNGKTILYNPSFFMSLSPEERVFLLLHEAMHVAYLHVDPVRRGSRDPRKWNIAADHVINLQLIERGFKMPSMGLADNQYLGMNTEKVYDALPEDPQSDMDDLLDPDGPSDELEKEIQDILVRATMEAKMANDKPGSVPGDIEFYVQKLLNPKLPWQRILQKYFQKFAKNDYTFRKPNRRFFPHYILPGLRSEALMDLTIAVDTSGSVTDEEFTQFITETNTILKMMKPDEITVIQFDTRIKSIDKVKNINNLAQLKFKGRGGTDPEPVFEWAEEHKPQAMLIFTDGDFRFRRKKLNVDTIWLIHDNKHFKPPFGKTVHYEM